jgi:hypothetical protein
MPLHMAQRGARDRQNGRRFPFVGKRIQQREVAAFDIANIAQALLHSIKLRCLLLLACRTPRRADRNRLILALNRSSEGCRETVFVIMDFARRPEKCWLGSITMAYSGQIYSFASTPPSRIIKRVRGDSEPWITGERL